MGQLRFHFTESKKLFFGIKRDFLESIAVAEKDKQRRERRNEGDRGGEWGEENVEREHGGLKVLGRATVQGVTVGIHYLTVYCHSCGLRFCLGREYRGITLLGYTCVYVREAGEGGEMQYPLFKNTFVEKSEASGGCIFFRAYNGNATVLLLAFKFIH